MENTTRATVQTLAHDMYEALEQKTRDNGETFYAFKDGSPEWMTTVAHDAHGDMMPDDWKYSFIREAVCALDEYESTDDARDSIEADVYTASLTAWLASNINRLGYCDEAAEEYSAPRSSDMSSRLSMGQWAEKMEVFQSVLSSLEALADDATE